MPLDNTPITNKTSESFISRIDLSLNDNTFFKNEVCASQALYFLNTATIRSAACLEKACSTLSSLLTVIREVLSDIKSNTFTQKDYDAHIGDCACQIRAFMLYEFSQYVEPYTAINNLKSTIRKNESTLTGLTSSIYSHQKTWQKGQLLSKYFKDAGISIAIPRYILVLSILKIISKDSIISPKGDSSTFNINTFTARYGIPTKYAKKLIAHYQVYVSKETCNYISTINFNHDHTKVLKKDANGRHILPCLYTALTLMRQAKNLSIPISFIIYSTENSSNKALKFSIKFINDRWQIDKFRNHAIYIQAFNNSNLSAFKYLKAFYADGFENLFLSYMAKHSQYVGYPQDTEIIYSPLISNIYHHYLYLKTSTLSVNHIFYSN